MDPRISRTEKSLADTVERFHQYLASPWRLMWLNFVGGIFRGLGTAIGATVIFALIGWMLTWLVDLPLIGETMREAQLAISHYAESTQYEDDFQRLEAELKGIREAVSE